MLFTRSIFGRLLLAGALATSVGMLGAACGGGGGDTSTGSTSEATGPTGPIEITFDGESDLFPSLNYSTGLLPPSSPVQASFTVTAKGAQKVHAIASPGGSKDAPTLTGLPGKGTITLDGGFFLVGQLKVDIKGLPSYDGPIPGIENIEIPIKGESTFDPFSIEKAVKVHADVPPTKLPGIPLPGAFTGQLILEIVEGSTVDLTFTGACAGVDGATATYDGRIDRAGKLVIKPSIEIKVPLLNKTETFSIDPFTIDLALGGNTIEMSAPIGELGSEPSTGDHVKGSCKGMSTGSTTGAGGSGSSTTGAGGAGTTGSGSSGTTGSGSAGTTGSGSSGSTGTGGSSGGVCDSGNTFGDPIFDTCASDHCCQEFSACTSGGPQACNDCLAQGGGALCDPLVLCLAPCAGSVCNSGVAYTGVSYTEAQCLSTNCCVEFNTCTMNGTQTQACSDCFNSGGGPGTVCQSAISCAMSTCGL